MTYDITEKAKMSLLT